MVTPPHVGQKVYSTMRHRISALIAAFVLELAGCGASLEQTVMSSTPCREVSVQTYQSENQTTCLGPLYKLTWRPCVNASDDGTRDPGRACLAGSNFQPLCCVNQ